MVMHRPAQLPLSATISPFSHRLHRKLIVHAEEDGLVLQPISAGATSKSPLSATIDGIRIPWNKRASPVAVKGLQVVGEEDGVVVDGVAGIVQGFQATLFDARRSKIYSVDQLVSVPLIDYERARAALTRFAVKQLALKARQQAHSSANESTSAATSEEDSDGEEEGGATDGDGGTDAEADSRPDTPIHTPAKSPFWQRLTPKKLPTFPTILKKTTASRSETSTAAVTTEEESKSGDQNEDEATVKELADAATVPATSTEDSDLVQSQLELDAKIVAECARTIKGMAFSYDVDITRSHQRKYESTLPSATPSKPLSMSASSSSTSSSGASGLAEPNAHLPLWRRADRRFFWNAHIMNSFIEAGLHAFIIVLQQGFVAHQSVSISLQPYTTLSSPNETTGPTHVELDMVLITRRSIARPGLRYQRRGVNPLGDVANFCETEFLVGANRDEKVHLASFVQTRGSIPVYWSQSPWALKPAPVLERTEEERNTALARHFEKQNKLYGKIVIVNLAEATGKEGVVVEAYQKGVEATQSEDKAKYVYFDFHHETKGMKYENLSKLITLIQPDLEEMQCFWTTDKGADQVFSTQKGIVRTNCIDCLDRTNVVQSAIARFVLNRHLVHLGIAQEELATHDGLDTAFNTMFADNGDAISREYAGTSALKGDFVRTGQRNWRGAVNDASNSVARLLQSTVTDFFRQATLDYVLGVNPHAFSEFSERLDTSDPGQLLRLAKIREEAIETSIKYCLSPGEEKLGGWTMLSPAEPNTVRSNVGKYEEKVVLVTSKSGTKGALYVVSYEYTLQKVTSFLRIALEDILSIQTGAYILSALDGATRDPIENYGLVLHFPDSAVTERVRTYTLKSLRLKSSGSSSSLNSIQNGFGAGDEVSSPASTPRFIALKALRRDAIKADDGNTSRIIETRREDGRSIPTARSVVEDLVSLLKEESGKIAEQGLIVERDIISLAEARSHTTIAERLSRGVQRLIWY